MKSVVSFYKKTWEHTFVRFLCVGSFNTLLDFVLLNILFELVGLPALVANSMSVTVGVTLSYFLNHKIVFRHPTKYSTKNYVRFFMVTGLSVILVQNLVIYVITKADLVGSSSMVHLFRFDISAGTIELNVAKALAVLVGMFWNYLFYKHVIFRHKNSTDVADEIIVA